MCDLYLTEEAKKRIADLRENQGEGLMYEQSDLCEAMSTVILMILEGGNEEKGEILKVLYVLQQYNMLVTELSKEN